MERRLYRYFYSHDNKNILAGYIRRAGGIDKGLWPFGDYPFGSDTFGWIDFESPLPNDEVLIHNLIPGEQTQLVSLVLFQRKLFDMTFEDVYGKKDDFETKGENNAPHNK
jgi:hypothetical protein